jgi:hypothetical protein
MKPVPINGVAWAPAIYPTLGFFASVNEKGRPQYAERPSGFKMPLGIKRSQPPVLMIMMRAHDLGESEYVFRTRNMPSVAQSTRI